MESQKPSRKYERIAYVVLIVILILFGVFKDHEAAQVLIAALKDAFSIILI
ncbi:MAG: hypothetical protein SNI91_02750 [Rikenellaceae bacterium]